MTYAAYQHYRDPTSVIGRRILAFVIDYALVVVLGFIVINATVDSYDIGGLSRPCDVFEQTQGDVAACFESDDETITVIEDNSDFAVLLLPLILALANWVILQGATGASLGKHITGLRVVDNRGTLAGYGRMLVRTLMLIIDMACFFLPGLISMGVSKGHRRLGDMVANTYVVGAQDVGTPPRPEPGYAPQPDYAAPQGGWTPPTSAPPPGQGWSPPPPPGSWPPPQQ
jgi:uncharacterized RDD family membrane protein YckC